MARFPSRPRRVARVVALCASVAAAALLAAAGCANIVGFPDVPPAGDAGGLGASSGGDATMGGSGDDGAGGSGAGSGAGGGSGSSGASQDAGAVEPPDCSAPEIPCGARCVNPITSGSNCGACNHSCGNGEMGCSQGQCAPVSVISDGPSILGFGVDQGSVFVHVEYDSGTGGIDQCAVDACIIHHIVSGPNDPNLFNGPITATGSYIAIQSNQGNEPFEYCPESNCTFTIISSSDLNTWVSYGNTFISSLYGSRADFFNVFQITDAGATHLFYQGNAGGMGSQADTPMALDGTNYVFSYWGADAGQHVVAAGSLDGGGQDSNLTILTPNVPNFLNVLNGVVYFSTTITTSSTVTTCPVTGCPDAGAAKLVNNTYPTTIVQTAIDPSGFYWLNSEGAIWQCKAGGCNGTGVAVTQPGQGDPQATQFVLNGGFVYFLSSDAKTIWRIAEPL